MSNWMAIGSTLNRTFSLYSGGQNISGDGGVDVDPVLKVSGIVGSIQTLSGDEMRKFGKTLQEADTYFNCLQLLPVENGDLIVDDNNLQYRVIYFEDCDSAVGRYFALMARKLIT